MLDCLLCTTVLPLAQTSLGSGDTTVSDWRGLYDVGLFLLAVIVPFVLGRFFANRLRMPTHAMSFSWILLAIIATGIVLATGTLKLGPDIKGGTNLIYQIDQSTVGNSGVRVSSRDFIAPLQNRINPSGMNESVVRPAGDDKIEIIIADVDPAEIEEVKDLIQRPSFGVPHNPFRQQQ